MQSLKSDIEEYCIICATNLSSIVRDSKRKRIDAWIKKKKRTGN